MVLILTTWSPTLAFQRTLKCWTLKFKWRTVHLELDDSHLTKYDLVKFKMDCIIADILKIVFGHNSASDCPISVKFCVEKQYFLKFRQWDIYPQSTECTFCFPNALSFGERLFSYRLRYTFEVDDYCRYFAYTRLCSLCVSVCNNSVGHSSKLFCVSENVP